MGVRKRPQPFLNISPLQKRKSEKEGGGPYPIRSGLKTCQAFSFSFFTIFFFFSFFFGIQFVTNRFDPLRGPGRCWWSAAAGGALSVCKLDDMAIVRAWAYMEAPVAQRVQPV